MADGDWNWKNRDGGRGGLLYESGNWGDILKLLWVAAVVGWKRRDGRPVDYFDPFAGDVRYPLGRKAAFRLASVRSSGFDFIRRTHLEEGFWPSSASAALLLAGGLVEVWDADAGRRGNWLEMPGVTVPEAESGWDLAANRPTDAASLWLIDPYDFLAEWRDRLPMLAEKSRAVSILLYVYNRSAKNAESFANYRAFRNALEVLRDGLPVHVGRAAADAFLPRAHHEMVFLPCAADCEADDFPSLLDGLGDAAVLVRDGLDRTGVFDC